MSYVVYLLRCADGTLYCGQTNNLEKRLDEHNAGKGRGAKYTRGRRPVHLAYREQHETLSAALKREAEIKTMTRRKKMELVGKFKGSA